MRSEEFLPGELRRWLQPPYLTYILASAGLVLTLVVCCVGVRKFSESQMTPVTTRLTETERERIERILLSEGLSDYEFEEDVLMVPSGQRGDYLKAVRTVSLGPRDPDDILRSVQEDMSVLLSREERLRRIQVADGEIVAELIRPIDGVDDVYVHFDEAMVGGLRPEREIKAVVSIRPSAGHAIDGRLLSSIRRTVAGHKAGLLESNVTVSNLRTGESYDGSVMVESIASQSLEIQRVSVERQWHDQVSRVLRFIPGVKVETTADLRPAPESSKATAYQVTQVAVAVSVPVGYYRSLWMHQANENEESLSQTQLAELEMQTRDKIESLVRGLNPLNRNAPDVHVAVFQELDAPNASLARKGMTSPDRWFQGSSNRTVQIVLVIMALGLVSFAVWDLFYEEVEVDEQQDATERAEGSMQDVQALESVASDNLRLVPETTKGTRREHDLKENRPDLETESQPLTNRPAENGPAENGAARHDRRGSFLSAELTDLVREHPQAASAMLKSWVEKAG